MNWPVALLALGMFGFWSWLAVVTYRYDPSPSNERDNRWVGIGGWLLLLTVVLALRPLLFGFSLSHLVGPMSIDKWSLLTTYESSKYNALWAPVLLFELAAGLAQWVFSLLLLVLLFRRRSSFPRVAILLLIGAIVLQVVDLMLASLLPIKAPSKDLAQTVEAAVGAVIWSAYLLRSRRVKSTFVMRYRVSVPPPLPEPKGSSPGSAGVAVAV
jgi:hypothetical protein